MKYWIAVVSKEHTMRGVAGCFMQACHGKAAPLRRMSQQDWVIFYSPKQSMAGAEKCQAFTAIGQVTGDNVYPFRMFPDFIPFRRDVQFYDCHETPILPLVSQLDFIPQKDKWGYPFRFGFLEINAHDFHLIKSKMLPDEERRKDILC
ncbi:EVE domain-containing protein [Chitinophaga vietnamensis]|uniref:EVE domain-containing protein n=1 Tax=Chitinophaga vietnamensis TaxID=2593957 RepID=UPI0011776B29|nr:EVE domain-containing protein [Chitinophaga vietnamensis]